MAILPDPTRLGGGSSAGRGSAGTGHARRAARRAHWPAWWQARWPARWPAWWPVVPGLAILFVPTFHRLLTGPWIGEEQGHGPIIFALALWLIWRKWPDALAASAQSPAPTRAGAVGWPLLAFGLALHLLGRSQQILMFEVGAILVVLAALVLLELGPRALRVLWFPFFFMLFMVPLPGELVTAVTMPMKMAVSWATEHLLFALGYPISRSGVVLQIGQYQLLVADACAGLQTLLTLEALGLFYLNLMRHPSGVRNVTLAILIVPISFLANVIRVIVLTLVTYHHGDAAGQGFLHGFAGMVLFATALTMILALDSALQWGIRWRVAGAREAGAGTAQRPPGPAAPPMRSTPRPTATIDDAMRAPPPRRLATGIVLGVAMAATAVLTGALTPTPRAPLPHEQFDLAQMIPARFGAWSLDPGVVPLQADPGQQGMLEKIYDQTLARTYVDSDGQRVMLSIAYGGEQSKSLQLHLPEVCYVAQGFQLLRERDELLPTPYGALPVRRLVARLQERNEPITYWITIGDQASRAGIEHKLRRLAYGLSGEIPDGMLVRVSTIGGDARKAYGVQDRFVAALLAALAPGARVHLIGLGAAPPAMTASVSHR